MDIMPGYSFGLRPRCGTRLSCGIQLTGRDELRDDRSYVSSFGTCRSMLCVSLGQVMTKVPPSQDL